MVSLRDAARRLPWALLFAAWAGLAWLWVWGPAALPYDPWGTAEPPGRAASVFSSDTTVGPLGWVRPWAWRRAVVFHPDDREGWEMLHGTWVSGRRTFPGRPDVTLGLGPDLPGLQRYAANRPNVRSVRLTVVDLLWPAGVLTVWTALLLAWGVRRRGRAAGEYGA